MKTSFTQKILINNGVIEICKKVINNIVSNKKKLIEFSKNEEIDLGLLNTTNLCYFLTDKYLDKKLPDCFDLSNTLTFFFKSFQNNLKDGINKSYYSAYDCRLLILKSIIADLKLQNKYLSLGFDVEVRSSVFDFSKATIARDIKKIKLVKDELGFAIRSEWDYHLCLSDLSDHLKLSNVFLKKFPQDFIKHIELTSTCNYLGIKVNEANKVRLLILNSIEADLKLQLFYKKQGLTITQQ